MLPAAAGWEDDCRPTYALARNASVPPAAADCGRCRTVRRAVAGHAWTCERASRTADFFVVVGSSLAVGPANLCPEFALANGRGWSSSTRRPPPRLPGGVGYPRQGRRVLAAIRKIIG
jgi:hypothetical protein